MKKRTITVEVLDIPFLPGDEYIANRYPHDGVFQLADGRFFAKYGTTVMVLCFPSGLNPFSGEADVAQTYSSADTLESEPALTGVDNLTFLKALAISKNPDLELDLCK